MAHARSQHHGKTSHTKAGSAIALMVLILLLASAAVAICGCGEGEPAAEASDTPQPASTEQGTIPEGVTKASDLHMAFFSWGSGNTYLQAGMKAAKDTAKKLGATMDVFDGQYDAATQVNQIETALSSGKYNAFVVEPTDTAATTPILLQAIADKKVLVASINIPLGGRDLNEGNELWEPGTVTFVGGQTHDIYADWMDRIIAMATAVYPDGGKAAAITGPKIGANAKNIDDVMEKMLPGTGIDLVANQETDYTAEKGYQKAQDILQANPDLRFMIVNYSGLTQGVVRAIEEAGLKDQVKVYDFGGNQWALDSVRDGTLEMTAIMLPYTECERAVEAIAGYVEGKTIPKFIKLTEDPSLPGTAFVTKDNVDQFTAQYK